MDILRRVRLKPYVGKPCKQSPSFALTMWAEPRMDRRGQTIIGYRLTQSHPRRVLFEGTDFTGSPLHADDSNQTVGALLGFLTLRPGDTDADYFAQYTPAQTEFCEQHAEALACAVYDRFGEG